MAMIDGYLRPDEAAGFRCFKTPLDDRRAALFLYVGESQSHHGTHFSVECVQEGCELSPARGIAEEADNLDPEGGGPGAQRGPDTAP